MDVICNMFDKFEIAIYLSIHWCHKHDSTPGDIFHKNINVYSRHLKKMANVNVG